MLKALVLTLTCAVAYSSALYTFHPEPVKKQAVYSSSSPPPGERYFGPQAQPNPLIQSNQPAQVAFAPQPVPYKSAAPPQGHYISSPLNSIPGQYNVKQQQIPYYPQFYPPQQQQQQFFPPSFIYVPPQPSRFPAATDGNEQQGGGSWLNWGSQQWPSWPVNWPQGGNFPTQFPGSGSFPTQFPGSGSFPTQFPSGGNFPVGSGTPAAPGGSPVAPGGPAAVGPESGPGTTTNTEGNSVVVVGTRDKPEKLVAGEPTPEVNKSDNELKSSFEQPPQYLILGQPQFYGGQITAFQGEKDPSQLSSAGKGAISSFLIQPQPYAQQFTVPQLLAQQQFLPQQQFSPQQPLSSQQQLPSQQQLSSQPQLLPQQQLLSQQQLSQDTSAQQASVPQQQSVGQLVSQQAVPQQLFSQQQFLPPQFYSQQSVQQQPQVVPQSFGQQFASQKQPVEVSNLPGASLAYQRFLQQNKQPGLTAVKNEPKVEISTPTSDPDLDSANGSGGVESAKLTNSAQ